VSSLIVVLSSGILATHGRTRPTGHRQDPPEVAIRAAAEQRSAVMHPEGPPVPSTTVRWSAGTVVTGVAGSVAVVTYSWWVATTRPFTLDADVATAVGLAVLVVVSGFTWVRRRSRPVVVGADARPGRAAGPGGAGTPRRSPLPWLVALGVVVAVELATYFAGWSGSRHTYPTVSSLYDTAARVTAVKAVFVGAWLILGWRVLSR
jgi:hypothetical protein